VKKVLAVALALALSSPARAGALVWPDVAERVERDLSAADPATRRAAARDIASLGPARGAALALAALGDADDEVRLAAADAAVRLRAAEATDIVAGWLNAPDVLLRRKACEVARALPSPRSVAPLARTLGDPDPEVRAAAAEALGNQASADAVPPLLGRLDDPTPAVRIQIALALARLGDARAVVPLVGKVQDSSPEVRQAVARALGDLGDPRASASLVLALRDQVDDVRRDVLAALGRMQAVDAVDAIAPFVADHSPSLRAAAFAALGRIASADAVRVLVRALGAGDDATGTLEHTPARDALVAAGGASLAPLEALLSGSPSPAEATSAAWVLGAMHARGQAPAIVAAPRRGTLPPAAALHALADAGTGADVPVVLEFLGDASPVVRGEALGAAAALLDPDHPDGRAVEPLAALLRDGRPLAPERVRIAALLGRTGAPRAAPLLIDLTRVPDMALRIAAIDALGLLGPAGADDALLEALASPDAAVRLHAALALSEAGGAHARDVLLGQLDEGREVDRGAVLGAVGGVLARAPSDAAVGRLARSLDLAAGAERDALIEALGRAPLPSAAKVLAGLASSPEAADRQAAASLLAAHPGDLAALGGARAMLVDADPSVRAQAAWSLGSIGDASDVARLAPLVRAPETDPAVDAAAAIGRIAARARSTELASRALCPGVRDPRPYVRANALAGVALAGARCGDGSGERAVLGADPNEDVRAAAALVLSRSPGPEDRRALDRCARSDASGSVASRCRARPENNSRAHTHAVLVYVVADGRTTPRPGAAYALRVADGTIHVGATDRRGGTFDPVAPEGQLALRPPDPIGD
jgi:cellulose synthase operon protein C